MPEQDVIDDQHVRGVDDLESTEIVGRVEGVDLDVGVYGWAYNVQDKSKIP